jgi:hypothetical protein
VTEPDLDAGLDDAVADQVVADPAGQFPGLLRGPGQQQDVLAGEVVGDESPAGQVGCLFGVAAAEPAAFVVLRQDRRIAGAQPEAGVAFPFAGEPDRLGELSEAELPGQHRHAAAAFDGGELLVVAGDENAAVVFGGQAHDGGEVGDRRRGGFVEDQQRPRYEGLRAAGLAAACQVAEKLGGVVRRRDASLVQAR